MLVDISRSVARVRENNQNVEKQKKKKILLADISVKALFI